MRIVDNKILEKYTTELGKKKLPKQDMRAAIERIKAKIVQTDEFIALTKRVALDKIETKPKKQVLDKERIDRASSLLKDFIEVIDNAYSGLCKCYSRQYKNVDFNKFMKGHEDLSLSLEEGFLFPEVRFIDKNDKDLLSVKLYLDTYKATIFDKNGKSIIETDTKDGVMDSLKVNFNKGITVEAMNDYVQNIVNRAKTGTTPRTRMSEFFTTTSKKIDYYTQNGAKVVGEYFPFDNPMPALTYLFNRKSGMLEKCIHSHNGIVKISNYDNSKGAFSTIFTKDEDKLIKSFLYKDLSKHNIKPYDYSLLKDYIE